MPCINIIPLFKCGSALSQATLVGRVARACARLLHRGNTPIPALCSSGKRGDALMWPHMYKQLFIGLVAWEEKYLQKKDARKIS